MLGSSITFSCEAADTVQWYMKIMRSNTYQEPQSNLLTVNPVKLKHSGYYYCYGRYLKKRKHFIARATLKVYGMHYMVTS